MWQSSRAGIALQEDFRMLQEVYTVAYYPPVVTAGRFLLPEHPTWQRGHCALVAFVWLFATMRFRMFDQITCIWAGKVTMIAFYWLGDIVISFLWFVYICIFETQIIIVLLFFHCQCVTCCSKGLLRTEFKIDVWSPIITSFMENFHFLDAKAIHLYHIPRWVWGGWKRP